MKMLIGDLIGVLSEMVEELDVKSTTPIYFIFDDDDDAEQGDELEIIHDPYVDADDNGNTTVYIDLKHRSGS